MKASMNYVTEIPKVLPAGQVLVHSHVRPRPGSLGMRGFRAWTQAPDATVERCRCSCAGANLHGHAHYRLTSKTQRRYHGKTYEQLKEYVRTHRHVKEAPNVKGKPG